MTGSPGRIHSLALLLMRSKSREDVIDILDEQLREGFSVDQAALVLFDSVPGLAQGHSQFVRVVHREDPGRRTVQVLPAELGAALHAGARRAARFPVRPRRGDPVDGARAARPAVGIRLPRHRQPRSRSLPSGEEHRFPRATRRAGCLRAEPAVAGIRWEGPQPRRIAAEAAPTPEWTSRSGNRPSASSRTCRWSGGSRSTPSPLPARPRLPRRVLRPRGHRALARPQGASPAPFRRASSHGSGLNPRSIQRRLSGARSFLKYLIREGELAQNPAVGVSAPRAARRLPTTLDVDQMAQPARDQGRRPGHRARPRHAGAVLFLRAAPRRTGRVSTSATWISPTAWSASPARAARRAWCRSGAWRGRRCARG